MTITISSQRHLDDDIVAAKLAAEDFDVSVSPEFEIDGEAYRVVLDGHHSLEAARLAGVEPDFTEQTATDNDHVALIARGEIEDFLTIVRFDGDFYNIATGRDVW